MMVWGTYLFLLILLLKLFYSLSDSNIDKSLETCQEDVGGSKDLIVQLLFSLGDLNSD